jgi:hypothetical protein
VIYTIDRTAWQGEDAFIIGGGPSLKDFDWSQLSGLNTIGCNQAFELGHAVCQICIFGDLPWFEKNKYELERYALLGGKIVSICPAFSSSTCDWLHCLTRLNNGLSTSGHRLGWNSNTGAAAINLALLMGAKRVYLLGFDNQGEGVKRSWHEKYRDRFDPDAHIKHREGFKRVASELPEAFPDREVINLNQKSKLECFPKQDLEEVFPINHGQDDFDERREDN